MTLSVYIITLIKNNNMLISIHTHNIIENIMVDLIYGRGISDILLEMPFYINLIKKYIGIKFFNSKSFIYGSVDINNTCNLHCSHCY